MRVALTGAATGIGAATAAKLKARGHEVVAFDIAEPQGVDRWIPVDMSDPASIDSALREADGAFDCLINNAGLPPREGQATKVLQVNFAGLVRITRAMEDRLTPGGAIVNTASKAGAAWRENVTEVKALMALQTMEDIAPFVVEHGIGHVRAYNLSKEAVIAWGLASCERLIAKDLRMNSVSPAAVSTGILDDFAAAFGDRMARNVARAGRPGTAQEIADVIVFLASEESRWLKGNDITIDGGMTAIALADQWQLA